VLFFLFFLPCVVGGTSLLVLAVEVFCLFKWGALRY